MVKIFENNIAFLNSYNMKQDWVVFDVSRIENFLYVKFQYNEWSNTYFNNHDTYLEFHKIYKVTSGYWDGKRGYWLTAKRIEKEIMCLNISEFIENKTQKNEYSLIIEKSICSNFINIKVESKITGSLECRCTEIAYTNYFNIGLFENISNNFVLATQAFEGDSTFIWSL